MWENKTCLFDAVLGSQFCWVRQCLQDVWFWSIYPWTVWKKRISKGPHWPETLLYCDCLLISKQICWASLLPFRCQTKSILFCDFSDNKQRSAVVISLFSFYCYLHMLFSLTTSVLIIYSYFMNCCNWLQATLYSEKIGCLKYSKFKNIHTWILEQFCQERTAAAETDHQNMSLNFMGTHIKARGHGPRWP